MSPVSAFKTLCLCSILVGACVGQSASPAAAAKSAEIRPAIFQRGSLTTKISVSPSVSQAQLSNTDFHVASDEEVNGMEQTLEHYVIAFESLSLPQVKQVWPELDPKHSKAFKDVFESLKGGAAPPRLGLQCAVPKVAAGTANVQCMETVTYAVGKGKTKEAGPVQVEILLKGQADHWVVQDMKGAS